MQVTNEDGTVKAKLEIEVGRPEDIRPGGQTQTQTQTQTAKRGQMNWSG